MNFRTLAYRASQTMRRALGQPLPEEIMAKFTLSAGAKDAFGKQMTGDLARVFFGHRGHVIHKWVHYLEVYEKHFSQFRNTPVRMLEIGVFKGGSLEMWREYFGVNATIFGIDINPECKNYVTPPNQVRIGSQDDPAFLKAVISEMGTPDIILDDGSHIGRHQRKSFDTLFSVLKPGGLYVIEDMHTSYWPQLYEGGHKRPGTAVEHVKEMLDDLHGWYHNRPTTTPAKNEIGALHMYDSIVIIEKCQKHQPGHIQVG